ncbi:hypothetical protein BGW42_002175 [Actinomortierella wolfii]|nr:hypothetical protein BGW42_002175 [Actinomortierella wolfii]
MATRSFLVCSGAPGIEATKVKQIDFSPHYYHILLDFGTEISLGQDDAELSSKIILGLRMAYCHFFSGKYDVGYRAFYRRVADHKSLFDINSVIRAIRNDLLPLDKQQQLFIFLHVDEFQRIFRFNWRGNLANVYRRLNKDHSLQGFHLFQDMARTLGGLLRGETFSTMESSPRDLAPSDRFPAVTLEILQRDAHTILEDSPIAPEKGLVQIPFFFLKIYNTAVDTVQNTLGPVLMHDWEDGREWRFFESIVAEYEALHTNLLIDGGRNEIGSQELSLRIADGASFANVFVYRESCDSKSPSILCALQAKRVERLSVDTLIREHTKNKNAIQAVPEGFTLAHQGIKLARNITVLITAADAESVLQAFDKASFPEDCLLIHRGNFAEYIGEAFSIPAALAATCDRNLNFSTSEDLKKNAQIERCGGGSGYGEHAVSLLQRSCFKSP